jgi:3-oxoacyl-[acyl-carrier protein] reductase
VVWPLGPSATIDASQWATAIAINVTAAARLGFTVLPRHARSGLGPHRERVQRHRRQPGRHAARQRPRHQQSRLGSSHLNLAAELAGTGITVNVFRPGGVDTAMQAWIRKQDPEQIGATLHQRFVANYQQGTLLTPGQSAASLLTRLPSPASGQIWDANDPQ